MTVGAVWLIIVLLLPLELWYYILAFPYILTFPGRLIFGFADYWKSGLPLKTWIVKRVTDWWEAWTVFWKGGFLVRRCEDGLTRAWKREDCFWVEYYAGIPAGE